MLSHMVRPYIVITSKDLKGWAIEYLWKGAAQAISLKTKEISLGDYLSVFAARRYSSTIGAGFSKKHLVVHHRTLFRLRELGFTKILQDSRLLLTHFESGVIDQIREIAIEHNITILTMSKTDAFRIAGQNSKTLTIMAAYAGIDRDIFAPSKRLPTNQFILVTGNCKARKNPELVFEVIRQLEEKQFIVEGKGWENYDHSSTLKKRNVKRVELNVRERAQLIREASLLLSLSTIEGGPLTLLEALASGTPVVSSDTGFAAEVIPNAAGTVIRDLCNLQHILDAIHQGLETKEKVFDCDMLSGKFSLGTYAKQIYGVEDNV